MVSGERAADIVVFDANQRVNLWFGGAGWSLDLV